MLLLLLCTPRTCFAAFSLFFAVHRVAQTLIYTLPFIEVGLPPAVYVSAEWNSHAVSDRQQHSGRLVVCRHRWPRVFRDCFSFSFDIVMISYQILCLQYSTGEKRNHLFERPKCKIFSSACVLATSVDRWISCVK